MFLNVIIIPKKYKINSSSLFIPLGTFTELCPHSLWKKEIIIYFIVEIRKTQPANLCLTKENIYIYPQKQDVLLLNVILKE